MSDALRQALVAARTELADIDARRARLTSAIDSLSALVGDHTPTPSPKEAPATPPRPSLAVSRAKPTHDDERVVLAALQDGHPVKTSDLRRRLKWSPDRLSRALRPLAATKQVELTGVTSGRCVRRLATSSSTSTSSSGTGR